jgi:peptide/nickel transport system permease protein
LLPGSSVAFPAAPPSWRGRAAGRRFLGVARPLARLIATTVTVLFLASLITFGLGEVSNSSPAAVALGDTATPEQIVQLNHQFGLDRPLATRYFSWLADAVQGDFGRSWFTTIPVSNSIKQALPVTLAIALLALILAIVLGVGAGIGAAMRPGSIFDRAVTVVCSIIATMPPFVIGIALIVLLAVKARLLPAGGYVAFAADPIEWLRFAIMPALALGLEVAAAIARQLRTSLVRQLRENYAVGAEMRGFSRRRVLLGHVLRNAVASTLAVIGMAIPLIIGGAVLTEKLFNIPGMAQLALQGALGGDVPVVQGTLLVTTLVVVIGSTVINGLQILLNPAARRGRAATAAAP